MRVRFASSMSIMVMLGGLWLVAQGKDFRPVTEAMLRTPAPGDWLNWRRTDNAWGFSPLDQINRQNVQQLQLAWSWSMDDSGAQEAAPLVYDGVMYLPNPRGVIQALDAATGDLIWEYRPEAQTPAPAPSGGGAAQTAITPLLQRANAGGGDRWGDLPLMFRAGGDAWIPGSYDPEANLVYWATAQAKPWARVARGTDGDALYTNSTLALDPDTGKMKWYYQHLPGETQDMDEVFENLLIDIGGRKSLFKMGKLGILWQLDRVSGAFVHATHIRYQTIVKVNPQTRKITYV